MRRWFVYIKESYDPNYPANHVIVYPNQTGYAFKGEEKLMEVINVDTGKIRIVARTIGLGYADFRDEEDYKKRLPEVIERKLKEVGIKREGRS